MTRTITEQQVAADGDQGQQTPGRKRDSIPPGSLRVSLRVQYIVHARNGQGDDGCRLRCGRGLDRGPQLALQLSRIGIDLPKLLLIAGPIEQDTLVYDLTAIDNKIANDAFLGRLTQFGVRLCLHGDVHELRPDVVGPYSTSRIHVVGTGSFGAGPADRPEATPRMYNLIEVFDDHTHAGVSTRQQVRPGAQFEAYAVWSVPGQDDVRGGRYEFALDPPGLSRAASDTI